VRFRRAPIVAFIGLLVLAGTATTAGNVDTERDRYLLLDSRIIDKVENAHLTVGVVQKDENNPLFGEDKPWEPRFDNPYLSVIYDEEEKVFKCWYSIFIKSDAYDEFPGEGLPSDQRAWVEWQKGKRDFGVCYATSWDGIHWGKRIDVGPIDHGDTNNSVWWDPDLEQYVIITRHWGGENTPGYPAGVGHRQKSRSVSKDFLNWSEAELVIDGLDVGLQIHDMPVVRYAGVYLGMVGLFDIEASKQWTELAWSPDSIEWHRIQPGTPLIPNGPVMGDYDWGCIFAAVPLIGKDRIRIYYGANDGRFMAWRNGYVALAWLRADGFAGYEQIAGGSNKTGSVTTKPVTVVGDSLRISADVAPSGYVKIEALSEGGKVLAKGELVTTTVTDAPIQWKEGFDFESLEGQKIALRFELRESRLFSFSFE